MPFRRLRGLSQLRLSRPKPRLLPLAWIPLQGSPSHDPWNPARFQWPSWGFVACLGIRSFQQFPGFQLWSLRLPDRNPGRRRASSNFSDPKAGTRTGGGALQSVSPAQSRNLSVPCPRAVSDIESFCSEDQRVTMPRSFRALLPARIRSRARLKPGAGRCSPGLSSSHRDPDPALAAEPVARLAPQAGRPPFARRLRRSRLPAGIRAADPTLPCGLVAGSS